MAAKTERNTSGPRCLHILARSCRVLAVQLLLAYSVAFGTCFDGRDVRATNSVRDRPAVVNSLAAGETVAEELTPDDPHAYEVNVAAGQYLRVLVAKADLRLRVTLRGPDGAPRAVFDGGRYGELRASLIAEVSGPYRLEVSSLEKDAAGRPYRLTVEELREATARDRRREPCMKASAEAEELRAVLRENSQREAIDRYADAWRCWRADRDWSEVARALTSIGEIYFTLSEFRPALASYQQALSASRLAAVPRAEAEALNNVGYAYVYLGENRQALRCFGEVLDRYGHGRERVRGADDRRVEAQALNSTGEVYYSLSDIGKALDYFNRALVLWESADDRKGQALAHINLGYSYYDSGKLQEAGEHYQRALSLWHEVEDARGEALAHTALGGVYAFLGEEQSALESHERAVRLFRDTGDRQGEAAALNGIGQAYENLNEPRTALDSYARALALYRQIGNRGYEALANYYVGRCHRALGEIEQALAYYERCIALSRRVGDPRFEAYALKDLGAIYDSQGDGRRALGQFTRVLRLYERIGDRRGQAYTLNSLGVIQQRAGRLPKAVGYFTRALSLSRAAEDRYEETSALYHIARAERDIGNADEALARIREAVEIAESLRTRVASYELRASYSASVHHYYELYIDLLMDLHRRRPSEGFAEAALQVSERARARSLLEMLTEAKVDIRQGADPALLDRERALQRSLDSKAEYQMRLMSSKHDKEVAAEFSQEIRVLTAQQQEERPRYGRKARVTQPSRGQSRYNLKTFRRGCSMTRRFCWSTRWGTSGAICGP